MALLGLGFVSCNELDDYSAETGPQSNLQESLLQMSDVTVSTTTQVINLADYINATTGDETPVSIGIVNVAEGKMPANTILKAQVEFSTEPDFSKKITLDAESLKESNEICVLPGALQDAYYNDLTHNPNTKQVYVRTILYTVTGNEAEAIVGKPGENYFDTHTVTFTPVDKGVSISSAYYIVGTPNGWSNSASAATSIKFEHSDADVYDDPIFTIVIDATYKGEERADTWFSILAGDDVDAFVGGDWNVLYGNTIGNGDESLSGVLTQRSAFGGECNMKMPATDGATKYQITIDALEGTYTIIPLNDNGAVFDTDPILYLTGSNPDYNWGSNKWVPLAPVCNQWSNDAELTAKMEVMSWIVIYLSEGEEFKFAPQAGWGDDFGMSATVTDIDVTGDANTHVFDPSSGDNIKMTKSGWYLLKVTNTPGARKVEFLKPNVYLIGNTSPAGWNTDASGLFTVPTDKSGQFVSPAFVADDEVRMCVNLGEGIDWWRAEFIANNGQIDYRANGGDQGRVRVNKGQKCYLNFTLGTGLYK